MTIKKPMKAPRTAGASAASSAGSAAIANRFKIDLTDPAAQKPAAGKGTTCAAVAGFVALVVAGILTYTLWKHWEFLMPA